MGKTWKALLTLAVVGLPGQVRLAGASAFPAATASLGKGTG